MFSAHVVNVGKRQKPVFLTGEHAALAAVGVVCRAWQWLSKKKLANLGWKSLLRSLKNGSSMKNMTKTIQIEYSEGLKEI